MKNFNKCSNLFFKTLNRTVHKCFKKFRIRTGNSRQLGEESIQGKLKLKTELKKFLLNYDCKIAQNIATIKLEQIEESIAEELAAQNPTIVKEHFERMETLEGSFSNLRFWKLKQKLWPMAEDPPMAKKDISGNIITGPEAIKKLYIDNYID